MDKDRAKKGKEVTPTTITIHMPSAPLKPYIQCLWYCNDSTPFSHLKVIPTPSLHLMINFGDAYPVYKADQAEPFTICAESWSVGIWNTHHVMDCPFDMQVLNVSFKPGGAYPFLQLPLSELHNHMVSLEAIWGPVAGEIRERLYSAPTIQARFALLEQLLLSRLGEVPHRLNAVQFAVDEIARNHGTLSIQTLSNQMSISNKHLITQFKQLVGATPKELARLYRFQHILFSINPAQFIDWTEVAHQSGYYDQSHFNKDFEVFAGHSPTDYLKLLRQVHVENSELAQYPHHIPIG